VNSRRATSNWVSAFTQLEEQFRLAQSKRFAPISEKLRDRVFDEAEQIAATEPGDDDHDDAEDTFALPDTGLPDAPIPAGKRRERKPLPAHLPRQRIDYDLPEEQKICPCCAHALHRMGEELSEQLHIEVKASVLQHVRFKYACRHCERHAERAPVITAPMPAQPLPGSNASAAMIATITAGKYVDGTPLYRMAHALARADIELSRGKLANWIIRPAELHYTRLYEALRRTLLSQQLVHGDETTVQVLKEPGRAAQSTSYMWVCRGCGQIPGLIYAAIPRLFRYSIGLRKPSETLIRFALYQRMYESTTSMNRSTVMARQSRG
jgi:transposase